MIQSTFSAIRKAQKLLQKWKYFIARRSSDSYLEYLKCQGVSIGANCIFRDVKTTSIDYSRPSLVSIGNNVDFNKYFQLLTHDWGGHVFVRKFNDFIPSHKRVTIGDNVYFGTNCVVLAGANIGSNCIIGACSMVNNKIPDNSVAVGIPAKVICDIDSYYERRKSLYVDEIRDYANSIVQRFNRAPILEDFHDDYPAFVDGANIQEYSTIPYSNVFTDQQLSEWKRKHQAPYSSFSMFLRSLKFDN